MILEEVATTLTEVFEPAALREIALGSWQVETSDFRLLVLLSDDQSWLRVLLPLASAQAAQPVMAELLEANFDDTQEVRYACHQGVVWGVFQHNCKSLTASDLKAAIARLISMYHAGLTDLFSQLIETRLKQIVLAAKQQGQSLTTTLQTLDRFYEEGILGTPDQGPESRTQVLAAWQQQLERLWTEVEL